MKQQPLTRIVKQPPLSLNVQIAMWLLEGTNARVCLDFLGCEKKISGTWNEMNNKLSMVYSSSMKVYGLEKNSYEVILHVDPDEVELIDLKQKRI